MEITYIGYSCFKIKGKNLSILIDPYNPTKVGYKLPKLSADVVLLSHLHDNHSYLEGVSDYKLVVQTAGEYEVAGTFIYGTQTYHDSSNGDERGANTVYQVDVDGISILHLGDLGHELSKDVLERLSDIDVLMIPVGGQHTINAETASKVISSIEPAIVIPMHYKTPDLKSEEGSKLADLNVFLEEMGSQENGIRKMDKLVLSSKNDVPEESEVYVLSPQH